MGAAEVVALVVVVADTLVATLVLKKPMVKVEHRMFG